MELPRPREAPPACYARNLCYIVDMIGTDPQTVAGFQEIRRAEFGQDLAVDLSDRVEVI